MNNGILPAAILGFFIFGIGAKIIYLARTISIMAQKSFSWPYTDGEVIHSIVKSYSSRSGRGGVIYKPDITYQYKINNIKYTSLLIRACDLWDNDPIAKFLLNSYSQEDSERIVVKYLVKSKVRVYFNPDKPTTALLEQEKFADDKKLYFLGGVLLIVGALFLFTVIVLIIRGNNF